MTRFLRNLVLSWFLVYKKTSQGFSGHYVGMCFTISMFNHVHLLEPCLRFKELPKKSETETPLAHQRILSSCWAAKLNQKPSSLELIYLIPPLQRPWKWSIHSEPSLIATNFLLVIRSIESGHAVPDSISYEASGFPLSATKSCILTWW